MRTPIYCECGKCNEIIGNIFVCDICGTLVQLNDMKLISNDTTYDFCNYSCLLKFILAELKKQPKEK